MANRFGGHCDTEALLLSLLAWGEGLRPHSQRGSTGTSRLDEQRRRLFMAVDRLMGVKPLVLRRPTPAALLVAGLPESRRCCSTPGSRPSWPERKGLMGALSAGPGRAAGAACLPAWGNYCPASARSLMRTACGAGYYWTLKAREHTDSAGKRGAHPELLMTPSARQLVSDVPCAASSPAGWIPAIIFQAWPHSIPGKREVGPASHVQRGLLVQPALFTAVCLPAQAMTGGLITPLRDRGHRRQENRRVVLATTRS